MGGEIFLHRVYGVRICRGWPIMENLGSNDFSQFREHLSEKMLTYDTKDMSYPGDEYTSKAIKQKNSDAPNRWNLQLLINLGLLNANRRARRNQDCLVIWAGYFIMLTLWRIPKVRKSVMFVGCTLALSAEFVDLKFTTSLSVDIKLTSYASSATTVTRILDFVIVIANYLGKIQLENTIKGISHS